jgi:hypothetical protein
MAVRILVDYLPTAFTDVQLKALFEPYGAVLSAMIVKQPLSGTLHFGYVEMESREKAERAVAAINAQEIGVPQLRAAVLTEAEG